MPELLLLKPLLLVQWNTVSGPMIPLKLLDHLVVLLLQPMTRSACRFECHMLKCFAAGDHAALLYSLRLTPQSVLQAPTTQDHAHSLCLALLIHICSATVRQATANACC